jgi:hypothetical protein
MAGCGDAIVTPPAPVPAGENTLTVSAVTYDDFGRTVPSTGAVSVTLVGVDRTVRAVIGEGSTTCEFHGLPANSYLLSAQQNGYFPYETNAGAVRDGGKWTATVDLYPHPSPLFRIDSITTVRSTNQLNIRLVTAQSAPASYTWRAAVFYSRSSSLNPATGTYEFTSWASGTGNVLMDYHMVTAFAVPTGTRLYVTARLMTSATMVYNHDADWNNQIFTNLEEKTTVVSSFVVE